jgi:signal transduction histidine kinase
VSIAADELTHVFERFYRVDKSRSRALGGSGIASVYPFH